MLLLKSHALTYMQKNLDRYESVTECVFTKRPYASLAHINCDSFQARVCYTEQGQW